MFHASTLNSIVIPGLAVLALGYAAFATDVMRPRAERLAPLAEPPARPFSHAVAAVGLVEPDSELIRVGPRVPGWVERVHVRAGESVTANQALFTLDGVGLRAELSLRQEGVALAEARLERLRAMPRAEDVTIAGARVAESKSRLADATDDLRFLDNVTDKRAIREEELSHRRDAVATAEAALAHEQAQLDKVLAGAWKEDLAVAEREVAQAKANVARTAADIEQLTVRAPIAGVILKLDARAGQYAAAGELSEPLLVMGSAPPWCVRVDINEEDARKVSPASKAIAMPRGDAATRIEMEFVRFEPYVVPKRALSGHATERVDTRALQAIYRLTDSGSRLFVGEQVDVYIERLDGANENVVESVGK